ncbi:hypothetical protein BUALT_Bualt17G0101800 [Buddleja alternifolia]|uniref:Bifunctional inhibitor/plant lipid transfer protein/seed storage helical domain-containing protein n=1 Tax=Buddleja alternifolia TaxID=168488 RepID=A0AAV6W855_9LAMI|nr:hypothetical protein BUALT_Bualt17G0101800 [Buddleja alternifolia]
MGYPQVNKSDKQTEESPDSSKVHIEVEPGDVTEKEVEGEPLPDFDPTESDEDQHTEEHDQLIDYSLTRDREKRIVKLLAGVGAHTGYRVSGMPGCEYNDMQKPTHILAPRRLEGIGMDPGMAIQVMAAGTTTGVEAPSTIPRLSAFWHYPHSDSNYQVVPRIGPDTNQRPLVQDPFAMIQSDLQRLPSSLEMVSQIDENENNTNIYMISGVHDFLDGMVDVNASTMPGSLVDEDNAVSKDSIDVRTMSVPHTSTESVNTTTMDLLFPNNMENDIGNNMGTRAETIPIVTPPPTYQESSSQVPCDTSFDPGCVEAESNIPLRKSARVTKLPSHLQDYDVSYSNSACLYPLSASLCYSVEVSRAVTCNPVQLSPCAPAISSSSKPSAACCAKVKEQRPCLCGYMRNPNLQKFIKSPGAKKVSRSCGVPYPRC